MASTISYPILSSSTSAINGTESTTLPRTLDIVDYCIGSLGLIGNIFTLIVLGSSSTLRKYRINKLIMHQSIIDLMGALFHILNTAIDFQIPGNYAYCVLWKTKLPFWIFTITSTFSLMLITIERYLAIVHTSWYERKVSDRRMIFSISIVWIIGFGCALGMATSTAKVDPGGPCFVTSVSPSLSFKKRIIGVSWFIVSFLFPVLVHVFCYIRMFYTLWVRMRKIVGERDIFDERNEENPSNNPKLMRNVVLTAFTITVCFISCWFWNEIFVLLYHLGYPVQFGGTYFHFSMLAVACNCCINPIVFMLQYKQFKEQAKKIICSLRLLHTRKKYNRTMYSASTISPSSSDTVHVI